MTGDLYFNRRFWLQQFDGDEQAVKFLELLFNRAGGSQAPDNNLTQLGDTITNISSTISQIISENDKLRHRVQELENGN